MNAGELDRRISILRKTINQLPSGEVTDATWVPIEASRPAAYRPLAGDERYTDPQLVALEQVEFTVRWAQHIADVSALDQVIYPAISISDPEEVLPQSRRYDIIAVHEVGRRQGLRLVTTRRVDPVAL